MASTISVTYASNCSVVETNTGPFVSSSDPTMTFNGLNESGTLTSSTTPPVTKHSEYELTMSSGSGSIDLTSLPGRTVDETVDATGLKLQVLKLRNKSTNANIITIAKGASNGYGLDASGTAWTITLSPGQSVIVICNDAAPDVASGARVLDVTGNGSQVLEVMVVLG